MKQKLPAFSCGIFLFLFCLLTSLLLPEMANAQFAPANDNCSGAVNETLDLRYLRNGMYMLRLTDGTHTWNRKLIIQER